MDKLGSGGGGRGLSRDGFEIPLIQICLQQFWNCFLELGAVAVDIKGIQLF